jgi:hypothetical protein
MIALIPLLASLVAAPAPAQDNPFGPSQSTIDQAHQNTPKTGTNPGAVENPQMTQLKAAQQQELKNLDAKHAAEYKNALNNPNFSSKAWADQYNKATLEQRVKMKLDFRTASTERKKGFEELAARHAKERSDMCRKQAYDRETLQLQIAWQGTYRRW